MNFRLGLLAFSALLPVPLTAQTPPPDEQQEDQNNASGAGEIIVTGSMRVRQGGAQDIRHFRSVAADVGMPRPESLTVEGLMGEHDLNIKSSRACRQLLCLATEAMTAALPARPHDLLFVGLGFTSTVNAETWQREPLNLIAVVDKSGSMSGQPLDLVRRSLKQIVGQMRAGDNLSIVLYGDTSHVYLQPTEIGQHRSVALQAIDRIESAGSTNMESGLEVGYQTAFATRAGFAGNTRLMLFTDEQPNVGRTDAASFMGMAETASRQGIGLTTVGVGVQFDGALATKVSSVRGGNLFFISNEDEVKSVFEKQLDTMVSELAHDVRITMLPQAGYRISGIFGVPDGLMSEAADGAVSVTVPTAFLSTNGGGIFVSLAKAGDRIYLPAASLTPARPLMEVTLSYVGAEDKRAGADRVAVSIPVGSPSEPLRLAQLLVDEYLSLKEATVAFHQEGNPKKAFALLHGFNGRLQGSGIGRLDGERKLVGDMLQQAAFYSGYTGEMPKSLRHLAVLGTWQVRSAQGFEDLRSGDRLSFSSDRELLTRRVKPRKWKAEETEVYAINERQIYLSSSGLVLNYHASGDQMTLTDEARVARLVLKRIEAAGLP